MPDLVKLLVSPSGFMPHGHCYLWQPELVWLHVVSDALIALAYTTIPFTLFYFTRRRRDLPFDWLFLCFAVFIISCGATHYLEIWTLWTPSYWLSGAVKAITAAASVPTAILLARTVPKALAIPSPTQFAETLRELARSEEKFRAVVEAGPDAMVIVDASGTIVLVNAQAERLFGYTRDELVGSPSTLLLPDGASTGELRARRKEGTVFPVELSSSTLEANETPLVANVIRDITDRKLAQAALELANRELEAFSYSVAHDLRAPLRGMNGFARILLDDYGDKLDREGVTSLEQIRSNAARMGELVDALLSLSRTTRSELRRDHVDLSVLATNIAAELAAAEPAREVDVVVEPGLGAELDPRLARAMLENLLGNAFKFTQRSEKARVSVGTEIVAGERAFFVRDNGAGFEMAYSAKLFEPFQRLHTRQEFAGSGVGLATVHRIVARHGGKVWAEGAVGSGATFYFTFPRYGP